MGQETKRQTTTGRRKLALAAGAAVGALAFAGYASFPEADAESNAHHRPVGDAFIADFSKIMVRSQWYVSNHSHLTDWLRTGWSARETRFQDNALFLSIRRDGEPDELKYVGGEVQKASRVYGFGKYEVAMRPAKGSGIISSFFTHTDQYFGDPHDEIDIEFVGRDTRIVYVNSFADGAQWGPKIIDLPFDAAEETHIYGFEWTPDRITWSIDGETIHTVTSDEVAIPQTPSRVMMNLWSGGKGQWAWHGAPEFPDGAAAMYECVSYAPLGEDDAPSCSTDWSPQS